VFFERFPAQRVLTKKKEGVVIIFFPDALMATRKNTIVCDNGTGFVKAGFAGANFPSCVFPSMVGRPILRSEEKVGSVKKNFLKNF
jgi:hypothetical protein